MKYRSNQGSFLLAFVDMLMCFLMAITFQFMMSYMLINPKKQDSTPTPKRTAEYLVRIFWQHDSPSDVDLWVQEPNGTIVFYGNKEGQVTHLERDDLGQSNDRDAEGKPIIWNEEDTIIRGLMEGWWRVSVHNYSQKGGPDPVVKWEFIRVKDNTTLASGTVNLSESIPERGCVQFNMEKSGKILEIKQDQEELIATPRGVRVGGAPQAPTGAAPVVPGMER